MKQIMKGSDLILRKQDFIGRGEELPTGQNGLIFPPPNWTGWPKFTKEKVGPSCSVENEIGPSCPATPRATSGKQSICRNWCSFLKCQTENGRIKWEDTFYEGKRSLVCKIKIITIHANSNTLLKNQMKYNRYSFVVALLVHKNWFIF